MRLSWTSVCSTYWYVRFAKGHCVASVPALRKDGARISVEFTIVPFADATGGMIGIAAVMRDITARFEEMRALRKELAATRTAPVADGGQSAV